MGCADERPSLLLVTIDTLRADHLPVYGYGRATALRIHDLAARGTLLETLIAPIPQTTPACASLLTGRWPASLGLRGNGTPLGPGPATLAELLGEAGWDTAAFVSGFPLVRRISGLDRGFAHYDDDMPDPRGGVANVQRGAEKTTDAVLAWLDARGADPFFLWLHYYDVHGDYDPGPAYAALFEPDRSGPHLPLQSIPEYQRRGEETDASRYVARYDGEIRRVDTELGRVLDRLQALSRLERTLVVVTADHGESLTEHRYYFDHGDELYLPDLWVPLVLAGPGIPAGRRIAGTAGTPDLMPTLLSLLGLPTPPGVAGVSLADAITSGAPLPRRESFAEARHHAWQAPTPRTDGGPKLAVRDDRFTAILRLLGPRLELYDRLGDPGETVDLAASAPRGEEDARNRASLESALRARAAAAEAGAPEPSVFTPSLRAWLEGRADTDP